MPLSGLARSLLQAGRITAAQAEGCSKKAIADKIPLIEALLREKAIDSRALAIFCSETFGYPLLDFSAFKLASLPEKAIDAKLMHSQRVLALAKRGNRLMVALSDPTNTQALELFIQHRPVYMSHLLLSHLSKNNNDPDIVRKLFDEHAGSVKIIIASRYEETSVYQLTPTIPPQVHRPSLQTSLFPLPG